MTRSKISNVSGFSLIELMIVVVIIGLISAYGYSIYTEKIIETRRSDAKEALSRLATLQEKFFTECNRYAIGLTTTAVGSNCGGGLGLGAPVIAWSDAAPFLSAEGHYTISIIRQGAGTIGPAGNCTAATCFVAQADPVGAGASGQQTREGVSDGSFRIDHAGRKSWANYRLPTVMDGNNTGMFVNGTGAIIGWSAR